MDQTNTAPLEIPPEIRAYIEGLLRDSQFASDDPALINQMVVEIYQSLDHFISARMVDVLSAEKLEEFIKMSEERKPQTELEQFLLTNIPNYAQFITGIFTEFRDLYLGKKQEITGEMPMPTSDGQNGGTV